MRRLVVGYNVFNDPNFRIMVDEAIGAAKRGEEVIYAACHGTCTTCAANPSGGMLQCLICRFFSRICERRLGKTIRVVSYPNVSSDVREGQYGTNAELKRIKYKGVNIGYAAFSEYVTWTRDVADIITGDKKRFLDYLLIEARKYVDIVESLIDQFKPDTISVFNCRRIETRPFLELGKAKGVNVHVCEYVCKGTDDGHYLYRKDDCENALPHNLDVFTSKVERCWNESHLSDEEKNRIADGFFIKRSAGVFSGESLEPGRSGVFTGAQTSGLMPDGFDPSKKNIVVFNSSEDELSSIDAEFEAHALYLSQIEGVKAVASALKNHPDYHVYLRIHPNLSKIDYSYHTDLYKLPGEFPNLTVIPATSSISTYALMSNADKVVVLGSTTGVESTYWGKPTILIGSAWYCKLDVAYKPRSFDEMCSMLLDEDLKPKPRNDARKYAFFLLERFDMAPSSYEVDFGCFTTKILGRNYVVPNWPRFFNSNILTTFLRTTHFRNMKFLSRNPLPVPYYTNK